MKIYDGLVFILGKVFYTKFLRIFYFD